jgi:hypothetical protein
MSRIAAPVGDEIIPIALGYAGIGCL